MGTVRHDKFQGLDGRFNVDPGVKYLFVLTDPTSAWAEMGYDFQYDARNGSALTQLDASGNPIPGAPPLSQTATDHSVRAFLGFKHAFNKQVTFVTGVEYLQSLYSSDHEFPGANYDYRINFDALFAANLGAGFSLGLGFSARYDNAPLPGKQNTDTITTVNLIYAFSDVGAPPPAPTCPCPPPAPAPPAESAPPSRLHRPRRRLRRLPHLERPRRRPRRRRPHPLRRRPLRHLLPPPPQPPEPESRPCSKTSRPSSLAATWSTSPSASIIGGAFGKITSSLVGRHHHAPHRPRPRQG